MSEKKMLPTDCPGQEKIDPRVRRTRKLLEEALRSLVAEKPFGEISVSDIAERATVNRATFYAHFGDKRHLASTMLRDDLEGALLAHLTPATPLNAETLGETAEVIFEFMGKVLGTCPKIADEFAPTLLSTLQDAIQSFVRTWLEHDHDAMIFFPGATLEVAATVVSWSIYGGALMWIGQSHRPSPGKAARQIVSLLTR